MPPAPPPPEAGKSVEFKKVECLLIEDFSAEKIFSVRIPEDMPAFQARHAPVEGEIGSSDAVTEGNTVVVHEEHRFGEADPLSVVRGENAFEGEERPAVFGCIFKGPWSEVSGMGVEEEDILPFFVERENRAGTQRMKNRRAVLTVEERFRRSPGIPFVFREGIPGGAGGGAEDAEHSSVGILHEGRFLPDFVVGFCIVRSGQGGVSECGPANPEIFRGRGFVQIVDDIDFACGFRKRPVRCRFPFCAAVPFCASSQVFSGTQTDRGEVGKERRRDCRRR